MLHPRPSTKTNQANGPSRARFGASPIQPGPRHCRSATPSPRFCRTSTTEVNLRSRGGFGPHDLARDVAIQQRIHQPHKGEQPLFGFFWAFVRPQGSVHSNQCIIVSIQAQRVEYQLEVHPTLARYAPAMSPVPEHNQLAIGSARDQIPSHLKSSFSLPASMPPGSWMAPAACSSGRPPPAGTPRSPPGCCWPWILNWFASPGSQLSAQVVFVRKWLVEIHYFRTVISQEQREEFGSQN
jgi:hypothetical protein